MSQGINFYLSEFTKSEFGVSDATIEAIEKEIGFKFPLEYVLIMKEFNGGEGGVGNNNWLCLFPIEDLIEANSDYSFIMEQIPGYFLFGKDAADTGYAMHKKDNTFHSFGLMSDLETDPIDFLGNSFIEFLIRLYNE